MLPLLWQQHVAHREERIANDSIAEAESAIARSLDSLQEVQRPRVEQALTVDYYDLCEDVRRFEHSKMELEGW